MVLSEAMLTDDPPPFGGWERLGYIVIKADGVTYSGWVVDVFRPGGILKSDDGTKTIVMPANENITFDPAATGGNHGFVGFPLIVAENDLSFAITGSPGGSPPVRTYFSLKVDELDQNLPVKKTVNMTDNDLLAMASYFDQKLTGVDRKAEIAELETDVPAEYPEIGLRPKEEAIFRFTAKPGSSLSSIHIYMWPVNNVDKMDILEINVDIFIDGEEIDSGSGFEDSARQSFYNSGRNPAGAFFPIDQSGYYSGRYFINGPLIPDGKVEVRFKNPDVGTTIRLRVEVKVIEHDETSLSKIK